jgi:diguanylate cyclase (GGDEF)-like protein
VLAAAYTVLRQQLLPAGTDMSYRWLTLTHDRFERLSRSAIRVIAIVGVLFVGAVDYLTGYEISFSVFYFGPVAVATWYAGWSDGLAVTLLSGMVWLTGDFLAAHSVRHPAISIWNAFVVLAFLYINAFLLNALRSRLSSEYQLARTDALTAVLNPRAFKERLEEIMAFARRKPSAFVLVYIDLDNLKTINDSFGHSEGDRVLREFAQTMTEIVRRTDSVARLGGDEFALLLPDTELAGAQVLVEKLRTRMAALAPSDKVGITCSVGAVAFREQPGRAAEAVRIADRLMYSVKRRGKNGVAWAEFDRATGSAVPVHETFIPARDSDLVAPVEAGKG